MTMKQKPIAILLNGIQKENPVFVLLLGMCPTLGTTTSATNGLGMGLGFTIVITLMSFVRELLGSGTLTLMPGNDALTFQILPEAVAPMSILALPPGGFFVFGVFMAIAYFIERRRGKDPEKEACAGCPSAAGCAAKGACETNGA